MKWNLLLMQTLSLNTHILNINTFWYKKIKINTINHIHYSLNLIAVIFFFRSKTLFKLSFIKVKSDKQRNYLFSNNNALHKDFLYMWFLQEII